jgi:hypothetical protein
MNHLFSPDQVTIGLLLAVVAMLLFIGLHVIWFIRPSKLETRDDLHAILRSGMPTIVEVYSNL